MNAYRQVEINTEVLEKPCLQIVCLPLVVKQIITNLDLGHDVLSALIVTKQRSIVNCSQIKGNVWFTNKLPYGETAKIEKTNY